MRTRALLTVALVGVSAGVMTSAADGQSGTDNLQPTPRDVVFDNVKPGGATVKTVTIHNRGTAAGKVTSLQLSSADFRVVADRCTNVSLAANATCGIDVEFRPTTDGTRVSHLRINDTSPCPEWVTLAGGGQKPAGAVARAASCQPVVQTVTETQTVPGSNVTTTTTTPGTSTTTGSSRSSSGSSSSSSAKCVSRRKLTVNVKKAAGVTKVRATLAGKAMKVTKTAKGWRVTVDMSNLKNGRYALRIVRERAGKKALTTVKRYSTCVTPRS